MKRKVFFGLLLGISLLTLLCSGYLYLNHDVIPSKTLSSLLNILDDDTSGITWSNQSIINLDTLTASNPSGILFDHSHITITSGGNYILSGKLANGSIIVDTDDTVNLTFNNASITNTNGPALYIKNADTTFLTLCTNTTNYLIDETSSKSSMALGALRSHKPLIFQGNGSLNITSTSHYGIYSDSNITFNNGSIKITSLNDCIATTGNLDIINSHLNLITSSTGIKCNTISEHADGLIKFSPF